MTMGAVKLQKCVNLFMVFGILYFVLYRIMQQKHWNVLLMKYTSDRSTGGNLTAQDSLTYTYTTPAQSGLNTRGRQFSVDPALIERLRLPPKRFFDLTKDTVRNFVFVTAVDTSHFEEVRDCVASIQKHFPKHSLILYDLGLRQDEVDEVKTWCNVEHRIFDVSAYPKHVKKITHKAFKFLVIREVLAERGAVFWIDASFRAVDPEDAWEDIFDLALSNGGLVMVYNETGDKPLTNYAWSDPVMFQFLPTDIERQKQLIQQCSCAVLIYNTEFVFRNILWWMYLCSLERECIMRASGTAKIDWQSLEPAELCCTFIVHRYDQSALNTILGNLFGYDQSKYTTVHNHNVIKRMPTEMYEIKTCPL